jgi:hypothetical protein
MGMKLHFKGGAGQRAAALPRWWVVLLCLVALNSCQQSDLSATLIAQNYAYATEVALVPVNLAAHATEVALTVAAAETRSDGINFVNQALALTVAAGSSPTVAVMPQVAPIAAYGPDALATEAAGGVTTLYIGANAPADSLGMGSAVTNGTPSAGALMANSGASGGSFLQVATASSVRESDGCAQTVQTNFSSSANRIYVVARASSLLAGTTLQAEWYYYGQLAWQDSFQLAQDQVDYCFWFYIGPEYLPLQAGEWMVRLIVNGEAARPDTAFTIS